MSTIVEKLNYEFAQEAKSALTLLKDVASMEKYISESYSERALIELLQNADDAIGKRVFIKKISNDIYCFANDGVKFTEEDLYSLCRSGHSTKIRGQGVIGYRGIGFKSVVNFSKQVHLISGEIKASFSREMSKKQLNYNDDIPLIRIPHVMTETKYNDLIDQLIKTYNTVFIFECSSSEIETEVENFDSKCMLFLNNLCEINIELDEKKFNYSIRKKEVNELQKKISFINEDGEWLVFNDKEIRPNAFAVYIKDDKAVSLSENDAKVFSFMPTNDRVSVPICVNGDFSTDPSRTKIVYDELTINVFKQLSQFVARVLVNIIKTSKDEYELVSLFSDIKKDQLDYLKKPTADVILKDGIIDAIHSEIKQSFENKNIYVQNLGMDIDDFNYCINSINSIGISSDYEKKVRGIIGLLQNVGFKEIPINDLICIAINKDFELNTRILILSHIIRDYRYGFSKELEKQIKCSRLFSYNTGLKSINEQADNDILDESFKCLLENTINNTILFENFIKHFNINIKNNNNTFESVFNDGNVDINDKEMNDNNFIESTTKFTIPQSKKWRSCEVLFCEILKQFENVISATDVSLKNLGYDIEVVRKNNIKEYYEVKSVNNIGEPFSLTTNEFSCMMQYKNNYYIAVIAQKDNSTEICIIHNPAEELMINRRPVRWEWYCDKYDGKRYIFE